MSHTPAGFHDPSRKLRIARFNWIALMGVPLAAILFQVYVPRFISQLSYLELPLLVTVYFPLMRRSPVMGVFFGAGVGLAQDSLSQSHHPLGMFGIAKTLVGYFAASVGQRFEVEHSAVRLVLAFFFFCFHRFFLWVLGSVLLSETIGFELQQTLVLGVLNAAVALPLYRILDRIKVTE
jgi:rod shape-determining protein MreD